MSMIKRGTSDSTVVVASAVYMCSACGHTEMAEGDPVEGKECPTCHVKMTVVSAQAEAHPSV